MDADKIDKLKERARWAGIGLGLRGLALLIMRLSKKDPLIARAVYEFDGVYRFENADGACFHYLAFGNGRVRVPRNWRGRADFTFTLFAPLSYFRRVKPEQLLEMAIGNKIGQTGNMYYLFQFGFIMGLVEHYFKEKKKERST